MYILIGRTKNYAWSLTSAGHDVRDVFAEKLCNPDGSAPTRASTHYVYKGKCRALKDFDAGQLAGKALRYKTSVHGSVIGTATVGGKPYALARKRSTFGRDGLNLAALHDMTGGKAIDAAEVLRRRPTSSSSPSTGPTPPARPPRTSRRAACPKRARGLDRRLPTLGTGKYEWKGFLSEREHPHDVSGPGGLLLNWNNHSAPGFMHGDDEPYGSVQRVELFDQFPKRPRHRRRGQRDEPRRHRGRPLAGLAGREQGAARRAGAERARRAGREHPRRLGAPRRSAPRRGQRRPLRRVRPGDHGRRLAAGRGGGHASRARATACSERWTTSAASERRPASRTWTRTCARCSAGACEGKFNLRYCGKGSLSACRASLWAAVDTGRGRARRGARARTRRSG